MTLKDRLILMEANAEKAQQIMGQLCTGTNVPYPSWYWGEFKGVTHEGAHICDVDGDEGFIPLEWLELQPTELRMAIQAEFDSLKIEADEKAAVRNESAANREKENLQQLLAKYGHPDTWSK